MVNRSHRSLLSFPFTPECAEPPPVKTSLARMSMAVRLQHTVCWLLYVYLHGDNRLTCTETGSVVRCRSSLTIMRSRSSFCPGLDRGAARVAFPFVTLPAASNRTAMLKLTIDSQCFNLLQETSQCNNYTCER